MIGPGKYDHICTKAREEAEAAATILIVLGGKYGQGFSCQAVSPDLLKSLPDMLETIAKQIRKDMG